LKYYYPWANDRIHTFILEGVNEKRAEFARRGIRYLFYLQRNARDPKNAVARLAKEAAALVTDDFPCFIVPDQSQALAQRVEVPVFAVDGNSVVPMALQYERNLVAPLSARDLATLDRLVRVLLGRAVEIGPAQAE